MGYRFSVKIDGARKISQVWKAGSGLVSLCVRLGYLRFYCKLLYSALQWEDSFHCCFVTTPPWRSVSRAVCLEIKSISAWLLLLGFPKSDAKCDEDSFVLCDLEWNNRKCHKNVSLSATQEVSQGEKKICPMVIFMTEKLLNKYWLLLKKCRLPIVFKMVIYNHFCKWDSKW